MAENQINNLEHQEREDEEEEDDEDENESKEEIELTLGLSLNGKFGVDPNANNLRRSFSISNIIVPSGSGFPWVGGTGLLSRTSSLPVEVEEESRKRKEVQMIRRWEAKRRRVEKMRNGSGLSQGFEFDGQSITPPFAGRTKSTEAKSPQSVQSLDHNERRSVPTKLQNDADKVVAVGEINPARSFSDTGEIARNVLADMPCVSTKGDGPNGKRIEGFLYRYKKGEEVRIVCVCHGSFLTPAEFVKHAGGGDVTHPLRHIVVNSSSFL